MGMHHGEQAIEIAASPGQVFAAITDYPTFPEWQDAVKRTEVVEAYPDGLGKIVDVEVDAKVKVVRYRLHYHYDPPTRIWWEFVEGDVKSIEGEYVLESVNGGTRAVYRLGIDPGVPAPALVARRLNQSVMKRSVEDLKNEAERRARS